MYNPFVIWIIQIHVLYAVFKYSSKYVIDSPDSLHF